jgi:16S rRNA (cytidine1402-2'-O)-methyltransferase
MNEIIPGTLYVVATPIGNLEDITLRALNTLRSVDIIACEDTRHSLKLLNHFEIKKRLIAYHSYNEKNSANGIIKLLQSDHAIALITDSGTPCISDPGSMLVRSCRENGINVVPVPGPSALIAHLSASGLRSDKFIFHGFLSIKPGRRKNQLTEMKSFEGTHIIYENPQRLLKLLNDIEEIFPEKYVSLGKELSKINENIITGKIEDLKRSLEKLKIIGEYVILIANY